MQTISKSRKWFYLMSICVILIIILPCTIYGFRLRELSSPERGDDDKSSKKTDLRDATRKPMQSFRKIVKVVHVEDDGTEIEEEFDDDDDEEVDEKYEFEKVHRSDFSKSQSVFKAIIEEEDKEEDAVVEEASQKLWFAFPSIFGLFGSSPPPPPPVEEESNGLINWIQSLLGSKKEKPIPKEAPKSESWMMSYLNRWPFNVFVPFEKSDVKIWIPPTLPTINQSIDIKEPLSQEHFEYLLYHLPNFVLKPSDIQDIECRNQILIFQRQLRGNKLWTLQMLDSSAKFPSGILKGNTNQFGDFDSCTQIRTLVKVTPETTVKIKGKYCLAHIDLKYSDNELKFPVHLAQGKGMWKGHIGNPGHLIPRYTTINWGICVPNQCSHKEVFRMLENGLRPYNSTGINFHIKVHEEDCFVRKHQSLVSVVMNNTKVMFTIGFYLTLLTLVLVATSVDYWDVIKEWASQYLKQPETKEKSVEKQSAAEENSDSATADEKDGEKQENGDVKKNDFERMATQFSSSVTSIVNSIPKEHFWTMITYIKSLYYQIPEQNRATISKVSYEILLSFSLKRTIPALVSTDPEVDIVSLHALKVLSTLMMYMFAKFLMLGHLSVINRDDMVRTLNSPFSILLRTPLVYMDTLLLIAGLLSSREMCKQLEQKAKISVFKIIFGKLIRSLPTLFAVLFFQSWILPYLGSGPLWSNLVQTNADLCEESLWRNLFGIQNFINVEESCSPFTTQLALDLQLLLIGCLLVWFYYNNEDVGFGIYGVFHAISVAARFSHTNIERLSSVLFHGMNVSKFYRTANISYSSPIDRATAYLIGIGVGVLIWTSDAVELNLSMPASILAWTSSVLGILWCFWYPWHNTKVNFLYDPVEAATYASWAPLFLSLALAWIIFASSFAPLPFNHIFNSKPLIFLSRIAYPMQLVIFAVVMYTTALNKEPVRFQSADLMDFGEIFIIICSATMLAIVIDHPFQNVRKILLETEFSMVSSHEEEDKEGDIDDALSETKPEDEGEVEGEAEGEEEQTEEQTNEDAVDDIWGDEAEEKKSSSSKRDQSPVMDWNDDNENTRENWRTESSELMHSPTTEGNKKTNDDEAGEEEGEEEEIPEEEEVVRRPSRSSAQSYRRRRWNFEEE